jgi:hypothetical protein
LILRLDHLLNLRLLRYRRLTHFLNLLRGWRLLHRRRLGFDYLLVKNFVSDWIHHLHSVKLFHLRRLILITGCLVRFHLLLRLLSHNRLNLHAVDAEVEVAVVAAPDRILG